MRRPVPGLRTSARKQLKRVQPAAAEFLRPPGASALALADEPSRAARGRSAGRGWVRRRSGTDVACSPPRLGGAFAVVEQAANTGRLTFVERVDDHLEQVGAAVEREERRRARVRCRR